GHELLNEGAVDDLQVGDHPAAVLEDPVIGKADELPVPGEVGGKGEGAAGQAPVVALAMAGAAAGDGNAVAGQVVHDATGRRVVRLEAAPHVRAGPEQLPFRLLHDRHGVLRRAADRLAAV